MNVQIIPAGAFAAVVVGGGCSTQFTPQTPAGQAAVCSTAAVGGDAGSTMEGERG